MECDNIWNFFGKETYIHFVAQETRIIRKLLIFNFFSSKKVEIYNAKVVFLLALVVIINESSLYIFDYRTLITDFDLFDEIFSGNAGFLGYTITLSK